MCVAPEQVSTGGPSGAYTQHSNTEGVRAGARGGRLADAPPRAAQRSAAQHSAARRGAHLVLVEHGVDGHSLLQQAVGKVHLLRHGAAVHLGERGRGKGEGEGARVRRVRGAQRGQARAAGVPWRGRGGRAARQHLSASLFDNSAQAEPAAAPAPTPTWISMRCAFFWLMGTLRTCRAEGLDKRGGGGGGRVEGDVG